MPCRLASHEAAVPTILVYTVELHWLLKVKTVCFKTLNQEGKNLKKTLAILLFALFSCGSVVLAGQNTNSSTTMEPNHNMSGRSMSGMRHRHRKHRRHRHKKMKMKMGNMNANTQ